MAPDPHGRLLSAEVAARLRISQSTVQRADRRLLPYTETPGGHRRYDPADVERYGRHLDGSQPIDVERLERGDA